MGSFISNLIKVSDPGISCVIVGKIEYLESCGTEGHGSPVAIGGGSSAAPGVGASPLRRAARHLVAHSLEQAGEKSQSVSKTGVGLL